MTIIGITGYKGSGKTTAATALYSIGFTRIRFADTLKSMLRVLGLSEAQIDGSEKETSCELLGFKTPRWAMQSLGTEWGRDLIDQDLWVNAWRKKVLETPHPIVADDVRFANEGRTLLHLGGTLLYLDGRAQQASDHPSEDLSWVNDFPHTMIDNSGTLMDLQREMRRIGFAVKGNGDPTT